SGTHRRRILEVALLILLVTVGVTALAARRLTRPLRALTRAAEDISAGGTDSRVQITGRDEVARLAGAFNEMAARRQTLETQRTAMVNDIAHELRTPVSNIRGWIEAAQDGLAAGDHKLVSSLLEETAQLTHLIEDLTDLAAAEAGALRIHAEPVELSDITEHVVAAHRITAEQAAVTISADADALLVADPVRLRQLLGNLVSNAIRHSPRGSTVTIRSRLDGDFVVVDVTDTGSGIPAADLDRIFDRFWRAEKSRARTTGGSGLGLPIVRRLAEAHGGNIAVQSTIGHGSTFTLRLPIDPREQTN
ncbi:MAG: sensor histidine kinase, partial [Trebonia sp.]